MLKENISIDDYAKMGNQYYNVKISPILEKYLKSEKYNSLIDCGCGDGGAIYALKKQGFFKNKEIYAFDLSKSRIEIVKKIDINIKAFVDDVETMSNVKDESIDFLISEQVIEHVDQDKMMENVNRVLKSGGVAYLSTVFKKWYGWYFYRCNGKWVLDPTHLREYTKDEQLFSIFKKYNLEILENHKKLIFFPLMDSLIKILNIKNREIYSNKFLQLIRKIKRPVPGYYYWEVVLRKK